MRSEEAAQQGIAKYPQYRYPPFLRTLTRVHSIAVLRYLYRCCYMIAPCLMGTPLPNEQTCGGRPQERCKDAPALHFCHWSARPDQAGEQRQ